MARPPTEERCFAPGLRPSLLSAAFAWPVRYPRLAWAHRDVLRNLHRLELLGRFRGSLLGVFWMLVQPLLLFAVYYFVFGLVFAPRTSPDPSAIDSGFALYLFSGVLAWAAFSAALARACTSISGAPNLIRNAVFPSELLPIPLLMSELVVYAAGVAILLVVGGLIGGLDTGVDFLCLPAVLLVHVCLTLGLGLLLATWQVFLPDTVHAYGVVSIAWLFASPVFWRPEFLTAAGLDRAAAFLALNPVYPLMQAHRQALGVPVNGPALWLNLGVAALWAVAAMAIGHATFTRQKHKFADLV